MNMGAKGKVYGKILLEGQSDHRGTLLNIVGMGCLGCTAANGHFIINDIPVGMRTLMVIRPGYQKFSMSIEIEADENTNVGDIGISPLEANVVGVVRLEGETDHQGILIRLGETTIADLTDPSGEYNLDDVPVGQYTLTANRYGYATEAITDLTVKEGEQTNAPQLTLKPRGGKITGKATLEGIADHTGIILGIGGTSCVAVTDQAGNFVITDVPVGNWSLIAAKVGWQHQTTAITSQPGQTTNVGNIVLTVRRANLDGTAQKIGETNHEGITVQLQGTSFADITTSIGVYEFDGVPEGQYTVIASATNYYTATKTDVNVEAGKQNHVDKMELQPSLGIINGKVSLEGEKNHMGIIVSVIGTGCLDVTDIDGSYIIKDVPVGTRTIITMKPGWGSKTASISVKPGTNTDVRKLLMPELKTNPR